MLQGPVGPFFGKFRSALLGAGFNPIKINFNGGDWLFAHGEGVINFRGGADDWEAWFKDFLDFSQPAFVVLMGDERPLHAPAIRVARAAGIPVWILEEGYIRPDFVTCELYGVNANSPLSLSETVTTTPEDASGGHVRFRKNGFSSMATFATLYYFGLAFGRLFFPNYRHYRNRSLVSEFFLWVRNSYRKSRYFRANHKSLMNVLEHHDKTFFVVALQVSDDMQLVAHGKGWTIERLITATIKSFALYADKADILVFKGHPLDRGHFPHGALIRQIAKLAGCEDRVSFIDDGSIGLMIRHAKGVIAVNSTSGLSALHHGTPLLCLGQALYNLPGLVNGDGSQTALDAFWRNPVNPDRELSTKLLQAIRNQCLVNGTFYYKPGFALTFGNLIKKFKSGAMLSAENDRQPSENVATPDQPIDMIRQPATSGHK